MGKKKRLIINGTKFSKKFANHPCIKVLQETTEAAVAPPVEVVEEKPVPKAPSTATTTKAKKTTTKKTVPKAASTATTTKAKKITTKKTASKKKRSWFNKNKED